MFLLIILGNFVFIENLLWVEIQRKKCSIRCSGEIKIEIENETS